MDSIGGIFASIIFAPSQTGIGAFMPCCLCCHSRRQAKEAYSTYVFFSPLDIAIGVNISACAQGTVV